MMKKNLFFFLAFVCPLCLFAQIEEIDMKNPPPPPIIDKPSDLMPVETEEPKAKTKEDPILDFVDKSASFPGGETEMMNFIKQNLRMPPVAKENNTTGRTILQFVVEKDGSISNIKVLRKLGAGCDEEAVRVIKAMPKWFPAMNKGETVRQRYTLPVFFSTSMLLDEK